MVSEQSSTVFIGRDRELAMLLAGLDDAARGHGRLFLLAGEPGIGKSRLADEMAAHARRDGHLVLWGRGWEDAGAPPYWPWVQALRTYLRAVARDELREQIGRGLSDVAQMLPELRELFPELPDTLETDAEAARFQLFDSTATFLRNAAQARRLLVVLDDLHAADAPSVLFLRFLATQLAELSLVVVATYRDVELTLDSPLTPAIGDLERQPATRLIRLGGLDVRGVRQLIGSAAGLAPQDHLVAMVHRTTSGNPLFVGEALRLMSVEEVAGPGHVPDTRLLVPRSVREAIASRIDRHLSPEGARVLQLAALLGPEFGLDLLRRLAESSFEDLLDQLDEAAGAGLIAPLAGTVGRFRFSHDLVREALYDRLATGERVRLHRHVARVLEELYDARPDGHVAELAYHHFEACREGVDEDESLVERAIDYARRAGEEAARSLAYEEAARFLRMALALVELRPAPDQPTELEILLALGEAESRAGDITSSGETFLRAAELARRLGEYRAMARAALGIGGRIPWGRPGRQKSLMPLLQDALVHLGGDDDRIRVRLLSRLACAWRSTPGRREESDALSAQALEIARQLNDPATLTYALAARFWAIWWPENLEQRLPLADEIVEIAEALQDGERLVDAHLMRWLNASESGDTAQARAEADTVRRLAEELRQPQQRWLGVGLFSLSELMSGDFDTAEELIEAETQPELQFTLAGDDVSAARMHRFLLRREQGRLAEEEASMRASVVDFPWYPLHRSALVLLLYELGKHEEAREAFDDLAQDRFSALYPDNEWLLGTSLAAEAAHRLDDVDAAGVLYEQLAPFAGRHAVGHAEGSVGAVDRYLGLLAITLGRLDDAERHLADAIRVNDRMAARPWSAHARHELARLLLDRGGVRERDRAARLLESAREAADRIGMPVLERRVRSLLDADSDGPTVDVSKPAVFRREGEYWTVGFSGGEARLRDSRGMRHLARLLSTPGQEHHALDLAHGPAIPSSDARSDALSSDALGDAGAVLDAAAKDAYRARIAELREELEEAEGWNDPERVSRVRAEIEVLTDELGAAVGLGGRDRRAASAVERARVSVTRAIRTAMSRLGDQIPALGEHLAATVRTGTFCSYTPDPRVPMRWEVRDDASNESGRRGVRSMSG